MKSKHLPNSRNSKHMTSSLKEYNKLYILPLILIMSILPLIMYFHKFDSGLAGFSWYPNNGEQFDIFLYCKQIFFIMVCSIMLLLTFWKTFSGKKKEKFLPIFIPLFIYGLLAFISTLFSDYPSFGFNGIAEHFESIFVILGYCLVVYYAYLFIETEDDIALLLKYFLIGILVMMLLGILQATGNDFLATNIGKKLYIPKQYWNHLDKLTFTFGPRRVYMTLYNPNYVGVYVSLILPLIAGLLLTEKKIKDILMYSVIALGLIICLIGSESKAGFISLFIALIFALIFYRRYIFRNIKITLLIIGISITIIIGFKSTIISIFNKVASNMDIILGQKTEFPLTDIKTEDVLTITYKGNDLIVDLGVSGENVKITMKDISGKELESTLDTKVGTYTIRDERFSGIAVTPIIYDSVLCTQINIEGKNWVFSNQLGDETYYYLNYFGNFDKIKKADSSLFTGYENFASDRGYIWSRTIPLLKENIILGSGADTFTTQFPHQDYVYRANIHYYDTQILTKPHSLYLQIGVQSGVVSLVAFLIFFVLYFISSIRIYINGQFDNYFKRVGIAIFIGIVSYMISGVTNDSTITVAPVAWTLIGIGITCNYKVKEQIKSEANK
ncbi:O-antigen ligase family protein [Anaerocolumna aminovalerica]|uniref:O-antigen ligase family protein n=1 Tax=Anaerocolumna aminovalerica TaxID=1527 RepID=UPI001C0E988F|nr:O-antigen ligase family protein [Anaerocolumna aminovalerica]MBU5331127.1 O-antigen ligase family protein [Anaerocolumna aminovalerica]